MKQEQKRIIKLLTEVTLQDKLEQLLDEICTNEFIESIKDKFEEKTNEEIDYELVKEQVGNVVVPFIFKNLMTNLGVRNEEIEKSINEVHMN